MILNTSDNKNLAKTFVLERMKVLVFFLLLIFSNSIFANTFEKNENELVTNSINKDQENNAGSGDLNEGLPVIYVSSEAKVYGDFNVKQGDIVKIEKKAKPSIKKEKVLANKVEPSKKHLKKRFYFVKFFFKVLINDSEIIISYEKNLVCFSPTRVQSFSDDVDFREISIKKLYDFVVKQNYNYNNPFINNSKFLGKYSVRPPTIII